MFLKAGEISISKKLCSTCDYWINSNYILELSVSKAAEAKYRIIAVTPYDQYVLNEFDTEEKAREWLNELVRKIEPPGVTIPRISVTDGTINCNIK